MKSTKFVWWVVLIALVFLAGCSKSDSGGTSDATYQEPNSMTAPVTKQQDVGVSLPASSSLNNETLKVVSFYGTSQVPTKANRLYKTLPVTVTDTTKGQIVILVDSQDNPLFFSYLEATTGTVTIDSEGIAKALLWLNPYVLTLPADQKKTFMGQAVTSTLFSQLKDKIDNLLVTDPKNLFNPDSHPEIVKTSFALVKETFEILGTQQPKLYKDIGASGTPRVLDKNGNDVSFENPKMTAYGIEVLNSSGQIANRILAEGKGGLVNIQCQWGWPPKCQLVTTTETESVVLNNGQYSVNFYKGFNTEVNNWWLPYIPGSSVQFSQDATIVGTATWFNTFSTIDILVDAFTGVSIGDHITDLIGRVVKQASNIKGLTDLALAMQSGDPVATLQGIVDLMGDKDNWKIITNVIWGSYGPDSVSFLQFSKALIKNISAILKAVDWINYDIPFIYDLGSAPSKVEYCIQSTGGVLSECSGVNPLIPPTASLSVLPIYPYVGDIVTFDASGSTGTTALQYSFDFEGDGNWTSVSTTSTATHSYSSEGTYNAKVEVKDANGQTAIANYYLTVYKRSQGISTAIVIDRSGSMSGTKMDDAINAAKTYASYMGTADRGAVIDFDDVVTITQPYTGDKNLLIAAIDSLYARNNTAFFDAVYKAMTETAKEDALRRRAVIALTDGLDNRSVYKKDIDVSIKKLQDVVDYAKQQGIPVYTIGLGSDADSTTLNDLASQTNGLYFYAPDSSQLQNIYDTISGIK